MVNTIEYIEENDYLIRNFKGTFHIDEILDSWKYLIENKLNEKKYCGILNDFSKAELKMKMDDLQQLMDLFKTNIHIFKDIKLAVVITTPNSIVFPIFAKKTTSFNIEIFSTIEAAKAWMYK